MDRQALAMAAVGAALVAFGAMQAEGQIVTVLEPAPVSAVFDGSGGFGALDGADDVEVFTQGGRTYAMVAAYDDDGVQIIDITNPIHPSPVSAVFDGSGGFGALNGAWDVEVFSQGGRTYAMVAAASDDGVQIIDITNPIHPSPVSAVFDGSGGFGALGGAIAVEVFTQGGRTYAIVAAVRDDGVQIMDITNTIHPSPVSAVFDGSGGFSALEYPNDVEVFSQGDRTYAIVTALNDDGVQIIDITNPIHPSPVSAVFDGSGGFSALDGAIDAEVFTQGGRTYAIVAAYDDDGVQIIDITNPIHPSPVSAVFDGSGGFSALDGAIDAEVFTQGGRTYAIVTAWIGRVQIMDITNPIHPSPVSAVFDDSGGFSALYGAQDVEVFSQGGRTYAIVAAQHDDGVQIMDITPPTLDLAYSNLAGEYLVGADLTDADLRYADLRGAVLIGAVLYGADLTGADLRDAILIDADLRNADLSRADLAGAHLSDARMFNADLTHANLTLANLRDADLSRADLRSAAMPNALMAGADLPDANLPGAHLHYANLRGADLEGADLTGAKMWHAKLRYADLSGADLEGADLEGADLEGADLSGADLTGAVLIDADLEGADLEGADLEGADLEGADLEGADLEGAVLIDADLEGADLEGAVLIDADLEGADLEGAVLIDADLEGADLANARLCGADLTDADLTDADLTGAVLPGDAACE